MCYLLEEVLHSGGSQLAKLRVKEIAEAQGIKQSHLQIAAAITPPLLYRYWHNKTTTINLAELEKIAIALRVEPGDLIVSDAKYAEQVKISEGAR